ncbi:hypothetical protein NC652_027273 [Populus alba x Populus x berolinensis]|nr:hypothetical protein NC652_027273 [Populus alba x Populus x berolinensis]
MTQRFDSSTALFALLWITMDMRVHA